MDAYLESLTPMPSPYLEKGKLSKAAARGRKCSKTRESVAPPATQQVSTPTSSRTMWALAASSISPSDKFFTPPLIEAWRTAPYLHDGSAATMRDVLTTSNKDDKHGKTSHLTEKQIEDLAAFVLSL